MNDGCPFGAAFFYFESGGRKLPGERFLYLNGEIIEESQARISPFDRGFLWGDGVYEITPCFGHKLYRLEEHIDRLYRSLRYVRIDPGISPGEMKQATLATLETNLCRTDGEDMYRVGHWVTRGVDDPSMAAGESGGATVLIFWRPVNVEKFANNYHDGVKLAVTATRRNPPECVETRAKVTSKMNQILAELDAAASGALSLMLDIHGNVAENSVANIFIVRDGVLWTPPGRNILEGVTRKVVFELAEKLGIPLEERNFTMYDVAQAEEYFLTSSAICAMPVQSVDGFCPKKGVPGPITRKLIDAFVEETGFDFRKALSRTGQTA